MPTVSYRPYRIAVDTTKPDAPPIISMDIQRIEIDGQGEIDAITGNQNTLYRKAEDMLAESIEFKDPVTGASGQISVAGLSLILGQFANKWASEDLNMPINPDTGWPTTVE